tara:strand:- start:617 stop:898 length:282 start_codon:yes stop_codon:yes gene_type:complete
MSGETNPVNFNNPGRATLTNADVASLGQAVLTLTRELWVIKDRMHVMEAVLAKHGLDISDEISQHKPDSDLSDKLQREGTDLIERVLSSLAKD